MFGNFQLLNIIKKIIDPCNRVTSPRTINVALEGLFNFQNLAFAVVLRVASRPIFSNVVRAHIGGSVRLW
jgi:hypothetical protein